MAIQIQGNGGVAAEVDGTTHRAFRVTERPVDYTTLGMYQLSAVSSGPAGAAMAAGLAALAPIFAFRWTQASNLALIYSIEISAGANVAATAAANCAFSAVVARTWSVVDTGGTAVTPATNDCKLRASMGASLVNDVRISTTATLTAGTRTLDGQNLGQVAFGVGTGAITTAENLTLVPLTQLFGAKKSGMPLVLTTNEGFIIRTGNVAFPATMTWHFGVNVHWAEVAAF